MYVQKLLEVWQDSYSLIIEHMSITHVLKDMALFIILFCRFFHMKGFKTMLEGKGLHFCKSFKLFFHGLSRHRISKEDMVAKKVPVSIIGWVIF
jgi:hypothetical protein